MEYNNQNPFVTDPWHDKKGRLLTITLILSPIFFVFVVYDGATFYARFKQTCLNYPDKAECQNFKNLTNVPPKPGLDMTLDYGTGKYAIQIGAYKIEDQAKNTATWLQSSGLEPRIIKVKDSRRKVWFQVQLGRFSDINTASQTAQQLKLKGMIHDFTVANYNVAK
jgi:hypothetical protein